MDFKNLRIAFVAGILGQGGAERQLYCVIKTLCELGCHSDVFVFSQGEYWEAPIKELGVRVISITESSPIVRLKKLIGYINNGNYEYIHSQHFYTNLYAVFASWICHKKCIGSIRNNAISEVLGMGFFGWLSLILPSRLAVNSHTGIRNAQRFLRKQDSLLFLPNYVDSDFFSLHKLNKGNSIFKVISVGTVWKPKRVDRIIEIAEMISQRSRNIVFEIIGDGDEFEAMVALAKSKSLLNSTVFFKGRSNNIANEYGLADMLLLTSDWEGTPNVVLEAMASGLPVVASNVGDVPELLVDGVTGFSVEQSDTTKMAEIIEMLSKDKDLCVSIGQRAREFVMNNYSQKNLVERLTLLYFPHFTESPFRN